MSTTYIGTFVMVLSALLPKLGLTIDNDSLTTFPSVLFTIGGGLWAMYGRWRLGNVNSSMAVNFLTGTRK